MVALMMIGCDRDAGTKQTTTASRLLSASGTGIVRGKVTFTGTAPAMQTFENVPCHDGAGPVKEETVVVNDNGTLRNVVVYLKDVRTENGSSAAMATIDQVDCRYVPHVIGVQTGQSLRFHSSDPTLHNVHYNASKNPSNNFGFNGAGAEHKVTFTAPEFIRVKCDVHPWMTGYVGVFENPWFAVSGESGTFELKGIPPGQYKLAAWHELYGEKELDVKVSDEQPLEETIKF
jgi:plastocyanin